jgi:hypothetical protein
MRSTQEDSGYGDPMKVEKEDDAAAAADKMGMQQQGE